MRHWMVSAAKKAAMLALVLVWLCPSVAAASWERGVALYKREDYRAALAEFQDLVREQPRLAGAWYYIGLCEFRLKRYDRVELPLSRAIELLEVESPSSKEIEGGWYTIGISHYLQEQYDSAIEPLSRYLERASQSGEPDPSAKTALGRAYYYLERFDDALPMLTSSGLPSDQSKELARNWYFAGVIHFKRENDESAAVALRNAVKANPEDEAANELLAESLIRAARKTGDETRWLEAAQVGEQLKNLRDDSKTAGILGRAYLGARQFEKATGPLERIAKENPENGQDWLYYGIALSRSGQLRKAMEALEITLQLTPDSIAALSELAYVYESDKQYQQALRVYERAFSLTRDSSIKESIERVRALASQP